MVIEAKREVLKPSEVQSLVKAFKKRLQKAGIPLKELWIFGSYAAGTAHVDSDLDVAVIVPSGLSGEDRQILNQIYWLAKQVHVKMEAHILSTSDLENPWLLFPAQVKRQGVKLF